MQKLKITLDNCHKYTYRITTTDDLERLLKFLYTKNQIKYDDIEYKLKELSEQLEKEKETFIELKRLEHPHWSDGRIIEVYGFHSWRTTKPSKFIEFKDTTLSNITLIYLVNIVKKTLIIAFILFLVTFVIPNLSPNDWAAIIIGSTFFLFLGTAASIKK